MATIYDVAERAGVSAATVSRVFNGSRVSQEKAGLVHAAAEQMGYVPDRTARALRTRTSTVIALIVVDIENPFFTSLARGVEEVTQQAGYSVVLCNTDEDAERERRALDVALFERMAGVILVPTGERSELAELQQRGVPVVTVDRALHHQSVDSVVVDNLTGGRQAAAGLYARGARRVACITGPAEAETAELRSAGWRQEFRRGSPDADPDTYLAHADYRAEGGRAAMAGLLELPDPPDAVFVANNLMAAGALAELRARRRDPPAFAMAAYGDLRHLPLGPSGVDIVPMPTRRIGSTAATVLLERIDGADHPPRTIVLRNEVD